MASTTTGHAVRQQTGELVTEDATAPEADAAQVRAADAGRSHVEQLTDTWRLIELDDCHSPSTLRTAFTLLLVGPLSQL